MLRTMRKSSNLISRRGLRINLTLILDKNLLMELEILIEWIISSMILNAKAMRLLVSCEVQTKIF